MVEVYLQGLMIGSILGLLVGGLICFLGWEFGYAWKRNIEKQNNQL